MFGIVTFRRTRSESECVLLLAIPLSRAEFERAWHRGTDFITSYAAACGVTEPGRLWNRYAPYAALCSAAVNDAEAYGIAVIRDTTLSAFAEAVGRFATVTLVAHSREPEIESRDIAAFVTLRDACRQIASTLDVAPPAMRIEEPTQLASWLDAALGPRDDAPPADAPATTVAAWRAHQQQQRWMRRQVIEDLCPGSLTGGPAVELEDGLWPVTTIDAALPVEIRTLDLTVCDSVLLAERLRARRTGGMILANAHPTTPDFRLALYRETVRLMARWGLPYHEAALRLRRRLRSRPARPSA